MRDYASQLDWSSSEDDVLDEDKRSVMGER